MKRLGRSGVLVVAGLIGLAPVAAHGAWAAFGSGSGNATATRVNTATAPTATPGVGKVVLSWAAVTLASGDDVDGYRVRRHLADGSSQVVCTSTHPNLTCDDTSPVGATVDYGVVAYKGGWTGPESPLTSFTYDSTAPVTSLTATPPPNAAGWNRTDVTVSLAAADDATGVASLSYALNSGTPTVVDAANTSFTVSDEGTTTITYFAVDNAGNVEATWSHVLRIDKTPPPRPVITSVGPDTGSSSTDGITNAQNQTIAGTATPNASLLISNGSTTWVVAADADGTFEHLTAVAPGLNTYSVVEVDQAGNVSPPASANVILDDTSPSGAITFPSAASSYGNNSYKSGCGSNAFDVCGTAADATQAGSGVASVKLTLQRGSACLAADGSFSTAACSVPLPAGVAGGSWSYITGNLQAGSYTLIASVADVAGNTATYSVDFQRANGP